MRFRPLATNWTHVELQLRVRLDRHVQSAKNRLLDFSNYLFKIFEDLKKKKPGSFLK